MKTKKTRWRTRSDLLTYQISDFYYIATLLSPFFCPILTLPVAHYMKLYFPTLYKISSRKSSILKSLKWYALHYTVISTLPETPPSGNQSNLTYSPKSENIFKRKKKSHTTLKPNELNYRERDLFHSRLVLYILQHSNNEKSEAEAPFRQTPTTITESSEEN